MQLKRTMVRAATTVALVTTGAWCAVAPHAAADGGDGGTVVVAAGRGADSPTCGSWRSPCATIGAGVAHAPVGGTVLVLPGTYREQVVVTKQLTLHGQGATVDATGLGQTTVPTGDNAAVLLTGGASRSDVEGFAVRGAYGEGILALGVDGVRIQDNVVTGNDLGTPATTAYQECQVAGNVPGDCGEGVHLMSSSHSTVRDNRVFGNSGGVLVTDEFGPAAGNAIIGNDVEANLYDCGITLPSHSGTAVDIHGVRHPTLGGVYDNVVADNRVHGNGTLGDGAGVLMAAAGPGGAVYDNQVVGNDIAGNGMAGVTIHSHAPQQDVNGNVIAGNDIGTNNLTGDPDFPDAATTGILVGTTSVPVAVVIRENEIHGNAVPVFTSGPVTIRH